MDAPERESRLPVGSSASSRAGWPMMARAMATRLALTARHLVGLVVDAMPEAHSGQRLTRGLAALGPGHAPVEQAIRDVVEGGHAGREVELLEDESNEGGAHAGQFSVAQRGHVGSADAHAPGGGPIQPFRSG